MNTFDEILNRALDDFEKTDRKNVDTQIKSSIPLILRDEDIHRKQELNSNSLYNQVDLFEDDFEVESDHFELSKKVIGISKLNSKSNSKKKFLRPSYSRSPSKSRIYFGSPVKQVIRVEAELCNEERLLDESKVTEESNNFTAVTNSITNVTLLINDGDEYSTILKYIESKFKSISTSKKVMILCLLTTFAIIYVILIQSSIRRLKMDLKKSLFQNHLSIHTNPFQIYCHRSRIITACLSRTQKTILIKDFGITMNWPNHQCHSNFYVN
jgi:hypothetical protein